MKQLDYERVFNTLVKETGDYVTSNHLSSMVLGISGGIDSTVVAAICYEVSKNTGIQLIGRSLPIKNKSDEFDVSKLVGEAFCDDFKVCEMRGMMEHFEAGVKYFENPNLMTPIAWGNIQARLRMTYLYNLASIYKGLVMSTDNQTEYQLGFWTIHGDVGDFDPIQDLWKTEVYGLAKWYLENYAKEQEEKTAALRKRGILVKSGLIEDDTIYKAVSASIALTPTDGLGISNSDLDQIGAKSYDEVDDILKTILSLPKDKEGWVDAIPVLGLYKEYTEEVVNKVWDRHLASEFKREKSPIYIPRSKYEE